MTGSFPNSQLLILFHSVGSPRVKRDANEPVIMLYWKNSCCDNNAILKLNQALSGTTLSQTDISQTLLVFREFIKQNKFRSLEYCQWTYVFLNMEFLHLNLCIKMSRWFRNLNKLETLLFWTKRVGILQNYPLHSHNDSLYSSLNGWSSKFTLCTHKVIFFILNQTGVHLKNHSRLW